jgi:hypothetical protein
MPGRLSDLPVSDVTGPALRRLALAGALALALVPVSHACGFEDPESVAVERSALQLAYPDAGLLVAEVTRAVEAGALATARQSDAQRRLFGLRNAMLRLKRLGRSLDTAAGDGDVPAFSLVLVTPVLWTRFQDGDTALSVRAHQSSPAAEATVVITEEQVIEALDKGLITARAARESGLLRFHGPDADHLAGLFDSLPGP